MAKEHKQKSKEPERDLGERPIGQAADAAGGTRNPFQMLVENITDYAIYMLDPQGIVTNWNLGAQRFKGYTPAEIVGQSFRRFFTEDDRQNGLPEHILATAAGEDRYESEGWRVRKDGARFWAHVVVDTIRDESGHLVGFAKITRDISEQRLHQDRLHTLAHYDSLTGLPNRGTLRDSLTACIAAAIPVTVLMLDLDGFKEVNDTLGHAAGDNVLRAAGERIKTCVADEGMVGRLGGDEFAVIVPDLADPILAGALCERLIRDFRLPVVWDGQESFLGLSIGIAIAPSHGEEAEELLANADLALYEAKADLRKSYRVFQPSLRQAAIARRHCDQELRHAVATGQLELHYQPQVRLGDYCVIGVEALLRWRHPQHGLLAPGAFLNVLERGALAPIVGDWAIQEAAAQARKIHDLGPESFRVSVNFFGAQLRRGQLKAAVVRALEENALPPEALELEITENIFIQQGDAMIAPLRELRDLGIGIAFDDYGTGFASLSLLKRFPLNRLKIDQSFIHNLCGDEEDAAVVRAIAYLAESFGLEVTAQGVEKEEQRKRLRELGYESAQGYLFGRPIPSHEMMGLIHGEPHKGLARWPRATGGETDGADASGTEAQVAASA
ncbi:MAG TPA: EAL domain-containing protein [Methyloceanibacter sp.]|nr:EAL domain-containing protein [Methyloceanibacter sp.]